MYRLYHYLMTVAIIALFGIGFSQEATNPIMIEIFWFDDAVESVTLQNLLSEFEAANEGVQIELVSLTLGEINKILNERIANGTQLPDLARTNLPSQYRDHLLDLSDYLEDPETWAENFRPEFLTSLRDDLSDGGLHGFPTDITISAPYINRSLFEKAGVPIPSDTSDEVTWQEWITATTQVQAATTTDEKQVYAIAIDQSGHRFWGPSLSMCATYVTDSNPNSPITIDTPGFRKAAAMLKSLHDQQLVPLEIWTGNSDTLVPATEFFIDNQVAFYFSGNWQLSRFESDIDNFDWQVIPNPVGDCSPTGMIGGSTMVAFNDTQHPEMVGKLVDFLTRYDNLARFYRENLLLPGQNQMAREGLAYDESEQIKTQLDQFRSEIEHVNPESLILQYHPKTTEIHGAIRKGLVAMLQDDLSIDETVELIESLLSP